MSSSTLLRPSLFEYAFSSVRQGSEASSIVSLVLIQPPVGPTDSPEVCETCLKLDPAGSTGEVIMIDDIKQVQVSVAPFSNRAVELFGEVTGIKGRLKAIVGQAPTEGDSTLFLCKPGQVLEFITEAKSLQAVIVTLVQGSLFVISSDTIGMYRDVANFQERIKMKVNTFEHRIRALIDVLRLSRPLIEIGGKPAYVPAHTPLESVVSDRLESFMGTGSLSRSPTVDAVNALYQASEDLADCLGKFLSLSVKLHRKWQLFES